MTEENGLNNAPLEPGINFGMRECRRYITGHDASGKAVYLDSPPLLWAQGGDIAGAHSYAVDTVPAELDGDKDLSSYLSTDTSNPVSHLIVRATVPDGVNWVVTNLAPGAQTRMHRTISVDSTICVEGHVAMDVDSEDRRELLPGVSKVRERGAMPLLLTTMSRTMLSKGAPTTVGSIYQRTNQHG